MHPSLGHTHAPFDLLTETRGSFDVIQVGSHNVDAVSAGQEVVAVGWALAGPATPRMVAVSVDGKHLFVTHNFLRSARRS